MDAEVTRGSGPARPALDRRKIAHAALELINEQGIEQLSMRRLAATLDVGAMALYHHFKNKAELIDGVKDYLLERVDAAGRGAPTPEQCVRRTFGALYSLARNHPEVFPLSIDDRSASARVRQHYHRMLFTLAAMGCAPEQAGRCYRMLSYLAMGAGIAAASTWHNADSNAERMQAELAENQQTFESGLDMLLSQHMVPFG